jgi:Ca2+-binding RTX toxin-like protein
MALAAPPFINGVLYAAAVSQGVTLDLSKGTQSEIANTVLTISSSTTIENAIGGAGNDILTGNGSNNRLRGNEGDDIIFGGAGIDTAIFSGLRSQYSLSAQSAGGYQVTDSVASRNGAVMVTGVERLQFSDTSLALDLDGNAGKVAKILGAIFGQSAVSNKSYVGIGLGYLDSGMSYDVN